MDFTLHTYMSYRTRRDLTLAGKINFPFVHISLSTGNTSIASSPAHLMLHDIDTDSCRAT